ncbi:kinase-like protein [Penicillium malachiteum]|uniref:kinase-like protein n=1 Tax=Penicillium malachiteum TaxID=1324776 RepID=UPI0025481993|nr:kinase-like protein [Penicillium malachiteum]KAJ5729464.1 kinase-like protein [Penicillium malachiteum]
MAPEITHLLNLDFTAESFEPETEISLPETSAALTKVPDEDIYPALASHSDITVAEVLDPIPPHIYLKRPWLSFYDDYKEQDAVNAVPIILLGEIYALQALSKDPHPGIIKYYGCRVSSGWITGFALEHHWEDLKGYIQAKKGPPIDEEPFLAALKSAICHVHSCGFAHNDIKPDNILLDKERLPVLTDFNSCQPIGRELRYSRGTPGWTDPEDPWDNSETWHDWFGTESI